MKDYKIKQFINSSNVSCKNLLLHYKINVEGDNYETRKNRKIYS